MCFNLKSWIDVLGAMRSFCFMFQIYEPTFLNLQISISLDPDDIYFLNSHIEMKLTEIIYLKVKIIKIK